MAQIKEVLQSETIDKLKHNQAQANEAVVNLGQIELRVIDLKDELDAVQQFKEDVLKSYKMAVDVINAELKVLEEKYPNGEIDLNEGVVIFEKE
jgi:uncharacterized protein involved in exopolysaccharide biosynthesis